MDNLDNDLVRIVPHLPEHLLTKILTLLPVTSLLRYKSVCKSWCTLIQTSFFIDLHISTTSKSSSTSKFGNFILRALARHTHPYLGVLSESSIIMLSSSSSSGGCGSYQNHEPVYKLDNLGIPSHYQFSKGSIVDNKNIISSCNGLICLYSNDFCLWNPATRQYRILPDLSITSFKGECVIAFSLVGFGFDVETKDYKIVVVTCYIIKEEHDDGSICPCQVQVYNLSTDSWRILEDIKSLPAYPDFGFDLPRVLEGFYLNGSCYFMAKDQNYGEVIISFDFTKEIFILMQLPHHQGRLEFTLTCLGEKLAFFTKHICIEDYVDDDNVVDKFYYANMGHFRKVKYLDFEIWVLSNDGLGRGENKKEWRKLHCFRMDMPMAMNWIPRGISNNGEFALFEVEDLCNFEHSKKMKLYNLVTTGEAEIDFLSCIKVKSKAVVYNPSLVSVNSVGRKEAPKASSRCDRWW